LSKQWDKSQNKPSCIALSHEFDGIAFLNILSGSVRQRLLQELTEARYGSGCSWRNISPAMIPHIACETSGISIAHSWCVYSSMGGQVCRDAGLHNFSAALP
jgi:hypothetical protein